MYSVIKMQGDQRLNQLNTPSATHARDWAQAESGRHPDTVYMVIRDGFGDGIAYAFRGQLETARFMIDSLVRAIAERVPVASPNTAVEVSGQCDRCLKRKDQLMNDPTGVYCPACFYDRMSAGELRTMAQRLGLDDVSVPKAQLIAWLIERQQHPGPTANRQGPGPSETKGV